MQRRDGAESPGPEGASVLPRFRGQRLPLSSLNQTSRGLLDFQPNLRGRWRRFSPVRLDFFSYKRQMRVTLVVWVVRHRSYLPLPRFGFGEGLGPSTPLAFLGDLSPRSLPLDSLTQNVRLNSIPVAQDGLFYGIDRNPLDVSVRHPQERLCHLVELHRLRHTNLT